MKNPKQTSKPAAKSASAVLRGVGTKKDVLRSAASDLAQAALKKKKK